MDILGVGYQTVHDSTFVMNRPLGYKEYLLLVLKTESFHYINGLNTTVPADSVIIYDPSTPQCYGATTSKYIDDWIHFSLNKEDLMFMHELDIPINCIINARNTEQLSALIRTITFEYFSANRNKNDTGLCYLRILLNKISEIIHADTIDTLLPFYNELVTLRTDIYNHPAKSWKIEEMSKQLGLSTSYLQHAYKKLFDISIINDVINSRISQGKKLLTGTTFSIRKIAELCGYEYDVYFMRQFKSRTGITPKEYRKQKYL